MSGTNRRTRVQRTACTAATLMMLAACGQLHRHHGIGAQDEQSHYAGLAFAVTDPSYASSQILYNDFKTGALKTLSSGESGDPWLKWIGGQLYLFNRQTGNINFRTLDATRGEAGRSPQIATPVGSQPGDPHDAIGLGPGRLLLADYNNSRLVVIDPATGQVVQDVTADWDFGGVADAVLRPEALYLHAGSDSNEIYVLHQGRGTDQLLSLNGTQSVFVLQDDGHTVTAVDLDPSRAKVQGIPLTVSNPSRFFPVDDTTALVYGGCSAYDPATCRAGFERVDLARHQATLDFDTATLPYKDNGSIVAGKDGLYYALMSGTSADAPKIIARIDTATKTAAEIYRFTGPSGCCALYDDASSNTLYTGDSDQDGKANFRLVIIKDDGSAPQTVSLSGMPYSGAFVAE